MPPRRRLLALALPLLLQFGCDTTATLPDFGIYPPTCRAPSACYRVDCPCVGANIDDDPSLDPLGCKACDPASNGGICDCTADFGVVVACVERVQVCMGQGMGNCSGAGALCYPAGSACGTPGLGVPPEQVAGGTDAAPATVLRCPLADDICCPGPVDAGVPRG